jgi:iron complex outermembrane receptor protein
LLTIQVAVADTKPIDVPAGDLTAALEALAAQSGAELVYRPEQLKGLHTKGVKGALSSEEAARKLIEGTSLILRIDPSGVLMISTPQPERTSNDADGVADVIVTGSRLARTAVEGPVPVNVYSRKEIERSGQSTVVDFLNTLTEVSVGNPEKGANQVGQTTVTLRGLPVGTTLVLLNGRRLQGGSFTYIQGSYFDLNNIPSSLVERIEIVSQGSSAVYGSDALGGVVNIILRNEFDGVEANVRYGGADGTAERSFDVGMGRTWERGSVSLMGSYFDRSSLNAMEREITSSNAYGTLVTHCNPGNVYAVGGGNLPGLDAPSAGVRPGAHAMPSLADFNAGQLNRCRSQQIVDLIPGSERTTVLGYATYRPSDSVELFAELMHTRQDEQFSSGRRKLRSVLVPASNAYNPFGVDVRVDYRFSSPATELGFFNEVEFTRSLIGAKGTFGGDWRWELAAWDARDKVASRDGAYDLNSTYYSSALASSDPATAINVFSNGAEGSDELLRSVYPDFLYRPKGSAQVVNGFVSGPVLQLPAGPLQVVIGGEYVRNRLQMNYPTLPMYNFDYRRRATSAYSEVRVPLIGSGKVGAGDTLAFTGAVRYEDYSDFGNETVPQGALEWRPWSSLLIRASYAESFKAPGLNFVYYERGTAPGLCCIYDPQRGGAETVYTMYQGGNRNLNPETGDSRSLGFVWSPQSLAGLEASASWWRVHLADRVSSPNSQTVVDNEALFPGLVVRDPVTNVIQSVDVSYMNFGNIDVEGIDASLSYRIPTGVGVLTPRVSMTQTLSYETALVPGSPAIDRLGRASNYDGWSPRRKIVAGLGWQLHELSASAVGRYVSGYTDYQDLGPTTRQLGDFWLLDVSGRFEFGKLFAAGNRYVRDAFVQVSIVNVLDKEPDYSTFLFGGIGYDPSQYDIRGRFTSISIGSRF